MANRKSAKRRAATGSMNEHLHTQGQSGLHIKFNETIAELSQLALTHIDIAALMSAIVTMLAEMLGADIVGILRHRPERNDFLVESFTGHSVKGSGEYTAPGGRNSQAGYTMMTHGTVIVRDMKKEKRFKQVPEMSASHVKSSVSVIINGKYRPYGVLSVLSKTKRGFTQQEVNFLKSVSNILAYCVVRDETEEEMKKQSEQLRAFTARLLEIREETTARIAREIHDELGQALTGLKFDLIALNKAGNARDSLLKMLAMSETIDRSITAVRRITSELRPAVLDDLGISSAIEWLFHDFQQKTKIKVKVKGLPDTLPMREKQATALFRIVQEALTNVARHANATRVRVNIKIENMKLYLEIKDNGAGILPEQVSNPRSFGLLGMKERAKDAGGTVTIQGGKEKGTTITVQMPVEAENA